MAVERILYTTENGEEVEIHPRTSAEQVTMTDAHGEASTLDAEFALVRDALGNMDGVDLVAIFEAQLQ